jgi:2',3'-cyclic-nucleotide 2'-phosphodiesterase (5'-nucleotidase family)
VDAGDLLFPANVDPSLSAAQKKEAMVHAQLVIDAFNLMGMGAVGVGPGELSLGAKAFSKMEKRAQFPFICANVVMIKNHEAAMPAVIKNAGGLRWGIFSLMSAQPFFKAQSQDWKVVDPVSAGQQVLKELQGKADLVILLAAMPVSELQTLLPQLPGVTIAVVGNNLAGLVRPLVVGQTIVVSSPRYGRSLGLLHLSLRVPQAPFVDEVRIKALEQDLAALGKKGSEGMTGLVKTEKARVEGALQALKQGNTYRHEHLLLSAGLQEDQGVQELIESFKVKLQLMGGRCL